MSHRVPLRDPLPGRPGEEHVADLPHRWVVGRSGGEYRHSPRSASRFQRSLTVHTLCGQMLHGPLLTDEEVGPECGTCYGRRTGLAPGQTAFAYRPRGIYSLPRTWCRGSDQRLYQVLEDVPGTQSTFVRCLLCGTVARVLYRGGFYTGWVSIQRHHHNGIGAACPDHGVKALTAMHDLGDGHLTRDYTAHVREATSYAVCIHRGGYGQGPCHQLARPFWHLTPAPEVPR